MFLAVFLLVEDGLCQDPWRRAFGALGPDEASSVRLTAEGDIITAGSTGSFGNGQSDAYLLKVSGSGGLLWSRLIGGAQIDHAKALVVLGDGSLVFSGYSNGGDLGGYDGWLVKTDPEGIVLWQHYYGGPDWDLLYDLDATTDGGFLLSGATYSTGAGASDGWLLRTDENGEVIWSRTFGASGDDELRAAFVTDDGGIVVAGSQWSPGTGIDVMVSKLNGTGGTQWNYLYRSDSLEFAMDVLQTIDGGFSIVGTTRAHEQFNEHLHLKLSASGDSLWSRHWGQINDQEATKHVEMPSGELYTVGYTETAGGGAKDLFLFRCTDQGDFILERTYGGEGDDFAASMDVAPNGFILAGRTNSFGAGGDDVVIVRTDSVGGPLVQQFGEVFDPVRVPETEADRTVPLFPNPASTVAHLRAAYQLSSAHVVDQQGRSVREWQQQVPPDLDLRGLSDGMYQLVTLSDKGVRSAQPLIISNH